MLPLRTEFLLRSYDSEESDSDSGMRTPRKKVQFIDHGEDHSSKRMIERRTRPTSSVNLTAIKRGDMPDGSDVFRRALREVTMGNVEVEDCKPHCESPGPLKSILKKK